MQFEEVVWDSNRLGESRCSDETMINAGDWRTVVLQALLIFMGAFIYLPFMKISERVNAQMAEQEKEEV